MGIRQLGLLRILGASALTARAATAVCSPSCGCASCGTMGALALGLEASSYSTAMLGTVDRSAVTRTGADVAVARLRRVLGCGGVGGSVGSRVLAGRGDGDGDGGGADSRATNGAALDCWARVMHSTQMPQRICCAPSAEMSTVMRRLMRQERHTVCAQEKEGVSDHPAGREWDA